MRLRSVEYPMPVSLPAHIVGLLSYVSQPEEKANEDLVLTYFRKTFGDAFTRQKEAKFADGYLPGSFVLELKGRSSSWLSGLFQGLAYKNYDLDFAQIVVIAKQFLAIWRVEDLPMVLREEVAAIRTAPSSIGKQLAAKYASRRTTFLKCATWNGADLFTPLFGGHSDLALLKIQE